MKKVILSAALLIAAAIQSQAQTILWQDFESGAMPAGWSQTTQATDGGWKFGVNAAIQSGGFQVEPHSKMVGTNDDACNCNKTADRFISPAMDLSAYTNVYMSSDVYFFAGTSNNKTETLKLEVSTNGGVNWTTLQTFTNLNGWSTFNWDISAYAGQSSVMISFLYSDAGGWLFGAAFDNVKVYAPIPYDMATTSIALDQYIKADSTLITGTMFNYGSDTITSLDINYSIDNINTVTQNLPVNILPLTSYNYTHPTKWVATDSIRWVKVWASNLNGNPDTNMVNDTASMWVSVIDTLVTRKVLLEEFTSSTSTPSASQNPAFNNFLNTNAANSAAIKYQMSYPAAGDPCYLAENAVRHGYYRVQSLPYVQMDGKAYGNTPANISQALFDAEQAKTGVYKMTVNWTIVNGAKVFVDVRATSKGQILPTADLRLHVVAVENSVNHTAQSNGETIFYDVNRKMITGENGQAMPIDSAIGQVYYYTGNWAILDVPGAPVDPTDLNIVAFVQDNSTGRVLQTAFSTTPTGIQNVSGDRSIAVYPNPFNNTANVYVVLEKSEQVTLEIYNLVGEKVYAANQGQLDAGMHTLQLDGSALTSGMYFVTVTAGERTFTQKVMLAK